MLELREIFYYHSLSLHSRTAFYDPLLPDLLWSRAPIGLMVRDHSFSTYAKPPEKLTFIIPLSYHKM